jgi:hypothetical protein
MTSNGFTVSPHTRDPRLLRALFATLYMAILSASVLYCDMEDVEALFASCIPLPEIAERLGVGRDRFYVWVGNNGFPVMRVKRNKRSIAAVTPETERAILLEARRQGFENPTVAQPAPASPTPDGSDQKGTVAYRLAHPTFTPLEVPRWTKGKTSSESGYSGDLQPLSP